MGDSNWIQDAEERGYREALLDVFCFLTANEQVLDIDHDRLTLLNAMVEQVTSTNSRLVEVP